MFSILLKRVVSVWVVKTEELVLRPRIISQRTIYTSNVLPTRVRQSHAQEFSLTKGLKLSKDPDELGKVVDFDFEELQREDIDNQLTRKKREKKGTKADAPDNLDLGQKEGSDETIGEVKKKKFEDLRRKNLSTFSSLMTTLKSRKGREKTKQIYLEGKRLIHDAIKAGHTPLKVYFSRPSDLEKLNLSEGIKVYRVPYKKLQFWSDVVTSQGVIGVFQMPDLSTLNEKNTNNIPLTVVCDNVREPSNLGSILRVVASVGCEKLILMDGCVDVWEPKVLRSAAGAHFHLPVLKRVSWDKVEEEIPEGYKVILASCDSKIHDKESETDSENSNERQASVFTTKNEISESLPLKCYSCVDYANQRTAIIIGGETHGLSTEAIQFAKKRDGLRVFIPMSNQVESLNNSVALGILSYMVRYQYESSNSLPGQENSNTEVD